MLDVEVTDINPNRVGWIYLITNKVNGKKYVGLTTTSVGQRVRCRARAKARREARDSNVE